MSPKKRKSKRNSGRMKRKGCKRKRYLLYSADTWEVCHDFPTIFQDLVSNYNSKQIEVKVEEEEVEEANSVHEVVNPAVSSSTEDYVGYSEGVSTSEEVEEMENIAGVRPQKTIHQCGYCEKVLPSPSHLIKHIRTHTREKPFQCQVCNKYFSQRGDLVRHSRTHTGVQPYTCTVCERTFSQSYNLQTHLLTHTGAKLFSCNICGSSFTSKQNLQIHMLVHTGEKAHKCSYCDKSFRQKINLKHHIMHHTGERPHVCDVCGEGFVWRKQLTRHTEKKHKN